MELFIDPDDDRGLTRQLYDQLRDAIVDGRLAPGARLLPTRLVAADLGVSRSTVTEVYGRLAAEGYVEGRAGGGSVVAAAIAAPPDARPAAALTPTARAAATRRYGDDPADRAAFDLRAGRVDPALFPAGPWRRCVLAGLRRSPAQYGDPAGEPDLRAALARWVVRSRGVATTPERIVVTSGAGHAVDLVARVLLEPGDVAAVEEPGYPPVAELLAAQGVEVVGVPVDEQGLVVDAIPARARLVHVTPSHQYPLGVVMSRGRRGELLRWASRHDVAVVEDDYDSEFRHTARPLEPLHRLDRDGRVVYVGTFSKSLGPGIRVGFLVAPPSLVPAIVAARQAVDWCPPAVTQAAMTAFIEDGHLGRHLRRARTAYRDRYQAVRRALAELLPPGYRPVPAQAGLHVAVLGPGTPPEDELHPRAAAHDLRLSSLRRTYRGGDPAPGFLVGFGALPTRLVPAAIRSLAATLEGRAGPP